MRLFLVTLFLLSSLISLAQSDVLAKEYFDKGQFEKAVVLYEDLYKTNKNSALYASSLIACYQALKDFDKAEKIISERYSRLKQPNILVELGYNYQLQNNTSKAEEYYKKAIDELATNIHFGSGVAYAFEQKNLLEKALQVYDYATSVNPQLNFDFQKARIYGQMGNLELMIESFLDYAEKNPNQTPVIQSQFNRFVEEDSSDEFTRLLRKSLLARAQKTQNIYWNEFLSWFFIQQKQLDRAFVQEKAIYKRNPESISNIVNLAKLAVESESYDLAREIFDFVLQNTQDLDTRIEVNTFMMELKIKLAQPKDYSKISADFESLLVEFGESYSTLELQILQARFIGFNLDNPVRAQQILNRLLELNLNNFDRVQIKLELGDMLLYEEKFNQALIYYSQIETDVKNHELGHQASLNIAKTSYYKGDFPWAMKQLTVLKGSFSQLIANDALDLYMLIKDNSQSDSTYTALKKFAKGDFLIYKNKDDQALQQFHQILKDHKGDDIESVTLLRIGQILDKKQNYAQALEYYQRIINDFSDGIYLDEALYFSAEIYNKHLGEPEKAKEFYEKIIFNHQDSIYFVDARKQYRILRGDTI